MDDLPAAAPLAPEAAARHVLEWSGRGARGAPAALIADCLPSRLRMAGGPLGDSPGRRAATDSNWVWAVQA